MIRAAALLLLLAGCAAAAEPGLAPPFDVARQRERHGAPEGPRACPAPVPAVVHLEGVRFYTDANHSVPDPDAVARNNAAMKPLREFQWRIAALTDQSVSARPPQPDRARCALAWMDAWAAGGALTGRVNDQGGYERHWALGGVALAYLKIRSEPGLDDAAKGRVEAWLLRIAEAMRPEYERPRRGDNRNNHAYWAGLSGAAVGLATGNRAWLEWGIERYRLGLGEITEEGWLPLERERRGKSFHYHLFAMTPLVLLAEIGERNGIPLYGERQGALHRLADRLTLGLADPQSFASAAGAPQDAANDPSDFVWLEPYCARFPAHAACAHLPGRRPVGSSRTGGSATLLWSP